MTGDITWQTIYRGSEYVLFVGDLDAGGIYKNLSGGWNTEFPLSRRRWRATLWGAMSALLRAVGR